MFGAFRGGEVGVAFHVEAQRVHLMGRDAVAQGDHPLAGITVVDAVGITLNEHGVIVEGAPRKADVVLGAVVAKTGQKAFAAAFVDQPAQVLHIVVGGMARMVAHEAISRRDGRVRVEAAIQGVNLLQRRLGGIGREGELPDQTFVARQRSVEIAIIERPACSPIQLIDRQSLFAFAQRLFPQAADRVGRQEYRIVLVIWRRSTGTHQDER